MSSTGSRKRKLEDDATKYYAVKAGHTTGVFEHWPDCKESITGFKGAIFKTFPSKRDAMDFVAGKVVKGSSSNESRFYGVAVGKVPGVYEEWVDAQRQIAGVKGPKFRRFPTRAEAEAFVKAGAGGSTSKVARKEAEMNSEPSAKRAKIMATSTGKEPAPAKETKVYTDGSSLGNGKLGAQAGVGVFFGDNDPRNVSEPLEGSPQTNQRAELTALLRAMEIVPLTDNIRIVTDSSYSINCSTVWYKAWQKNGWTNSKREQVMNQDLIRSIRALIEKRNEKGVQTTFEWIKGHSNDPGNEAADRLAVAGARRQR